MTWVWVEHRIDFMFPPENFMSYCIETKAAIIKSLINIRSVFIYDMLQFEL